MLGILRQLGGNTAALRGHAAERPLRFREPMAVCPGVDRPAIAVFASILQSASCFSRSAFS